MIPLEKENGSTKERKNWTPLIKFSFWMFLFFISGALFNSIPTLIILGWIIFLGYHSQRWGKGMRYSNPIPKEILEKKEIFEKMPHQNIPIKKEKKEDKKFEQNNIKTNLLENTFVKNNEIINLIFKNFFIGIAFLTIIIVVVWLSYTISIFLIANPHWLIFPFVLIAIISLLRYFI